MQVLDEHQFKLILGLKIQEERKNSELSLQELAQQTGLSKSYLNEIEKGKKYPKPDKLQLIAHALDVEFEYLAAPKLEGKLEAVYNLITSPVLQSVPLDFFGIQPGAVADLIAKAPDRVRALFRTVLDLGQHYNISRERLYFAVLQSYQEMHWNYFPKLEAWSEQQLLWMGRGVQLKDVEQRLQERGLTVQYEWPEAFHEFGDLRSLLGPQGRLYIREELSDPQKIFILLKELYYLEHGVESRPRTFPWITFETFDEVLHNFEAGYAAGAVLLPKLQLAKTLNELLVHPTNGDLQLLLQWIAAHPTGTETLLQRMTNILPGMLGMKHLFFLRLTAGVHLPKITKQLHLLQQWNAYEIKSNEHYCARWLSMKLLSGEDGAQVQLSQYPDGAEYLVIGAPKRSNNQESIALGLLLDRGTKRKLHVEWDRIEKVKVGHTCERCPIADCQERLAPSDLLEESQREERLKKALHLFGKGA